MENRPDIFNYPPYESLRLAIVELAVRDYEAALKYGNEKEIKSLERFFLSKWGQYLSDDHGEYIINRCRKEHEKRQPKKRKTVKITPIERNKQ